MTSNPLFRRIQNVAYVRLVKRLAGLEWRSSGSEISGGGSDATGSASSISASSGWVEIAGEAGEGKISTTDLRRLIPVMDIVETVPPGDGATYAGLIRKLGAEFLSDEKVAKVDLWGNPVRWPGFLLGTPRAFSPTTLRYLATALWMREKGIVSNGGKVVEIGVGFGGLAAMNAVVSGASTVPLDLPQVEGLAARMLEENGLGGFLDRAGNPEGDFTLVSNYAFTELSAKVQDIYFEKWIRHSKHGLIVSNANIFSRSIGGRDDSDLLALLCSGGLNVTMLKEADLLCRADYVCDVSVFVW